MQSCYPSDSVCRPRNLQKRRPPNCGATCVGKMPAAVQLFRTTAGSEPSLGLRLRDSRKAPTGGPVGKRSSGESEGYAGTGAALYSAPLTAQSGQKKKYGAVETHRAVRLTMSAYSCDAGAAWTSGAESTILLPAVVRFRHRNFARKTLIDAVRILLDRLVPVEEVVEQ